MCDPVSGAVIGSALGFAGTAGTIGGALAFGAAGAAAGLGGQKILQGLAPEVPQAPVAEQGTEAQPATAPSTPAQSRRATPGGARVGGFGAAPSPTMLTGAAGADPLSASLGSNTLLGA